MPPTCPSAMPWAALRPASGGSRGPSGRCWRRFRTPAPAEARHPTPVQPGRDPFGRAPWPFMLHSARRHAPIRRRGTTIRSSDSPPVGIDQHLGGPWRARGGSRPPVTSPRRVRGACHAPRSAPGRPDGAPLPAFSGLPALRLIRSALQPARRGPIRFPPVCSADRQPLFAFRSGTPGPRARPPAQFLAPPEGAWQGYSRLHPLRKFGVGEVLGEGEWDLLKRLREGWRMRRHPRRWAQRQRDSGRHGSESGRPRCALDPRVTRRRAANTRADRNLRQHSLIEMQRPAGSGEAQPCS